MAHFCLSHRSKLTISTTVLAFALGLSVPLVAQLENPLPSVGSSGLGIDLKDWITIPASDSKTPRTRIVHLKPAPGGTRLFCNDLRGKLWLIESKSSTQTKLFLDMEDAIPKFIESPGLGTGFASFAFHPEFASVGKPGYGKLYTAHVELPSGTADFKGPVSPTASQHGVIFEWSMANHTADSIGSSPGRELLRIEFPHHFHGLQEIAFDPTANPGDENYGNLFICLGEGGSMVIDQPNNMGRIDSVFGSVLRIAPILASGHSSSNFTLSGNGDYYIPSGSSNANPFVGAADPTPGDGFGVVREIYAYGFRNPHRLSWDSGGSHKLFVGNIGESNVEEVELIVKGGHYGWPAREGSYRFEPTDKTKVYPLPSPDTQPSGPVSSYRYPVAQYDHDQNNLAVVGGYVYRGSQIPELRGYYVFGDIVSGRVFASKESEMVLEAPVTSGATPADVGTVALSLNGVPATFLSIVGSSRADLRFGTDHAGELYALSKINGKIYRMGTKEEEEVPVEDPPEGDEADWALQADFEGGLPSNLAVANPGLADRAVDPREGGANHTLRLRSGTEDDLEVSLPIPSIEDGEGGTVFFRVYFANQEHNTNWGLSDAAVPTGFGDLKVQLRSFSGDEGKLVARDGGDFVPFGDVEGGSWYDVWLHVNNVDGSGLEEWRVYLRGGGYSAPTLVQDSLKFRDGTNSALRSFFWIVKPGTEMHFDDIFVDVGHFNLTSPRQESWRLVDNFEGSNPLENWQITTFGPQGVSLSETVDGDSFLRQSTPGGGASAASIKLPFLTQVSETVTLFRRFRFESGTLEWLSGISGVVEGRPGDYVADDFESQARLTANGAGGALAFYDGPAGADDFVAAKATNTPLPELEAGVWYDLWTVAFNGGFASGGQKYNVYLRGGAYPQAIQVAQDLFFRREAEAPLVRLISFLTASSGTVWLDDIYAHKGVELSLPAAAKKPDPDQPGPNEPDPDEPGPDEPGPDEPGPIIPQADTVPLFARRSEEHLEYRFLTETGYLYRLEGSNDLLEWTALGDGIAGTGGVISRLVPLGTDKVFRRVVRYGGPDQ